jgi:NADH-quinone oxidoreductase subunit H
MSELIVLICVITILLSLLVVLLERKFLAYAQRRLGPSIMGRNGAFQIALDLGKLLTKEIFLIPRPSSALAPVMLVLYYAVQLAFAQNFVLGPSLYAFDNVDGLLFHHLILVLLSNIFLLALALISQSRYATIATIRAIVHIISLDIFVTIVYVMLVLSAQSAHFHEFVIAQEQY